MVSTASGASDQGVWGLYRCNFGDLGGLWSGSLRCLCMHLFKPVPMLLSAAMSDIGGRIYHRLFMAASLSAHTYVITWDCSHWPLHVGGRELIKTCLLLTAAALSSRSDVIRIVFSLAMSSSLVYWIGPTAVRKKVACLPQGRGLIAHRHMNVEFGTEAAQILENEYINGIFVAVYLCSGWSAVSTYKF